MKNELSLLSEENLVKLLAAGDEKAFEKLYAKYKEKLYYYCFSILSDPDASEDVVQDTFIKVWENRKSVHAQMSFSSYLFTIVHNKAVTYIRRLQTEKTIIDQWLTEEYSKPDESTMTGIISGEYELFFKKAIENLSPKRKLVFQLSREEGLSHKEIAEQLGISVYTVQEHISETLGYFKFNLLKHPDLKNIYSTMFRNRKTACRIIGYK
ncbi:MAG: RNA polymerase sigma-70 factor [Candidatus Azobacteroides sp.]|nr:RNA polymerase sigma-70 factor [Candidatus Azobacteroides sp.]